MSDEGSSGIGLFEQSGVSDGGSPIIGKILSDRYQIRSELGRGGMGIVYLAWDSQAECEVAIKMLTGAAAHSPELRSRFQREAETASKLSHPGICAVRGFGEFERLPFMAMDYLRGISLGEIIEDAQALATGSKTDIPEDGRSVTTLLLDRAQLERAQAREAATGSSSIAERTSIVAVDDMVRLIERAARALHVAHEADLVHRDVKPANIMVSPDGKPVILDFGLARDLEAVGQTLTESGQIVGTPAYLAPEQIIGKRAQVDRRTDIYALGVTLYECLTLQRPFKGGTWDQLFHDILIGEWVSPRKLNPHIPPNLGTVVEKAMERDQRSRYATAEDFAEDLRRVRSFEPIHARPPGPVSRVRRWARRRPGKAAAAAAVIVMVLATAGFFVQQTVSRAIALGEKFELAEALLAREDFAGALDAVAQARELDPSSERARALRSVVERKRDLAEREARRRSDLAAAGRAREEFAKKEQAYDVLLSAITELERTLELERGASFGAYATEAVRGAFARREGELSARRIEAERLLQEARQALQRSARLEASWGGASPETESGFAAFYFGRWREALAARDAAKAAWFRTAVEQHDHDRRYEAELLGRGQLTVFADPADAEFHLFRHEPYQSVRQGDPIPRLVPVPTSGIGRVKPGAWIGDFHPGDHCIEVTGIEPESPAARAGLYAGDLVIALNGVPCGRGVFVRQVAEQFADRIPLLARISALNDHEVKDFHDWLRGPRAAKGDPDRIRLWGDQEEISCSWKAIRVAAPRRLVEGPAEVSLRLLCLRAGEEITVEVPAGTPSGIRGWVTAYPLICAAGNRIAAEADIAVDPGSYLLHVRCEGYEDLRLPVMVPRGCQLRQSVALRLDGTTPPGFVFVPPGAFIHGGDPEAFQAGPREGVELPGFLIAEREVTHAEWFEFLNDPETLEKIAAEKENRYLPRDPARGPIVRRRPGGQGYDPGPGYWPPTPIFGISWNDVHEYLAWRNRKAEAAGEPWTYDLPTALEWEKAARGADGRCFPWGNRFDFSLAIAAYRKGEYLQDVPWGFEPCDASPYGIWDLGGSRQEWIRDRHPNPDPEAPPQYGVRGGAWGISVESAFRSAGCGSSDGNNVSGLKGFRLALRPRS